MVETGSVRPKVFISYSRRDMAFADRLEAALKTHGFDPLIDRTEIYAFEDWWTRIQILIARADTIIFVLSPDAVASEVCAKEVAFAASLNKRFAPIVHRRVDGQAIPDALARLNFIFFDDEDRFDDAMTRLVEALSTDIEWIRKHTEFGEQARRWAQAGRPGPRGLLLRPPMLEDAERWIASRPAGAPQPTEATQSFVAESRRASTRRRTVLSAGLGAGLIVALALAGLAYWQRDKAVRQEQIATEQRSLAEKSEAQAKIELDKALVTQSRFLANVANQSVDAANAGTAMAVALEALPDERAGRVRPYAPEAESALFGGWQSLREIGILQGEEPLFSARFSLDGRRILTVGGGNAARIWDADGGKVIVVLHGDDSLWGADLSPDGRRIVTVEGDGVVRIRDVESGKAILALQGQDGLKSAAFSPDGRRVVTTTTWEGVRVWDADSGKMIAVIKGHDDWVLGAAFSPDSQRVVTTSRDYTARIWDAKTGNAIRVLKGHDGYVYNAAFSPDGRRVVTASNDRTARIWDVATGKVIAVLKGHDGWVWSAAFSPDGRRIVTASADRTVRIWDVDSGKVLAVLQAHEDEVYGAAFSPDGRRIVTASLDKTARIWSTASSPDVSVVLGNDGPLSRAAFSADGRRVVTASMDKTARVWDADSGKPIVVLRGHQDAVNVAAFSPNGRRVVTASADKTARVWDAESGAVIAVLRGHTGDVSSAAFSPDGQRVITTSSWEGVTRIWEAESGKVIAVLRQRAGSESDVAFTPDGRRIVTTSADKTARIRDADSGRVIAVLQGHDDQVLGAAFSPDGRRVATTSADKTARIWDADSGRAIAVLQGHDDRVLGATFGPDGRRVVTASADKTARIWDADSGRMIAVLEGYDARGPRPAFSPDGRRLVVSADKTARIWDAAGGNVIAVLQDDFPIESIEFSRDGRRILTTSAERTGSAAGPTVATPHAAVRIRDADSGKVIAVIKKNEYTSGGAAFSPDGRRVLTGEGDWIARIWRVFASTQEFVDEAKRVAPRCLTGADRVKAFLDAEPPEWCIEMEKWPYRSQDWKDWLRYKRAKANPPLPDAVEWKGWIAAHR